MQYFTLPKSDMQVSRVAAGCMGFGGSWDHEPVSGENIQTANLAIDAAMEAGINLFDHADIYTHGKAEETFGRVLLDRPDLRSQMLLQSKCGIQLGSPDTPQHYNASYTYIMSSVEEMLTRLHTDYLDVLLLHRPDPLTPAEETARAFTELHAAGKVRWFGVSNHSGARTAELQHAMDLPLVSNQLQLSLLHHLLIDHGVTFNHVGSLPASDDTLEYCRTHGMLIQAWSPLDGGILTGRGLPDTMQHFQPLVDVIAAMAVEKSCSPEAIVLSWLLKLPGLVQPVIGSMHPGRIAACAQADTDLLSRTDWYRLYEAARGNAVP